MPEPTVVRRSVTRIDGSELERVEDEVAVERALEIRVGDRALSVTLRTPGHDEELAVGFLWSEGLLGRPADLAGVVAHPATCVDQPDLVEVALAPGVRVDWSRLERHFVATAACGLCGRAHLDSLRAGLRPLSIGDPMPARAVAALPGRLREVQSAFTRTGGLHAAASCDPAMNLDVLREDVGRHNAVDKIVGWLFREGRLPAADRMLWVSGRAGAEIVLKAARAGFPVLAAVGAPSSLAIELAEAARLTLIGFLREGRMNVYSSPERIAR